MSSYIAWFKSSSTEALRQLLHSWIHFSFDRRLFHSLVRTENPLLTQLGQATSNGYLAWHFLTMCTDNLSLIFLGTVSSIWTNQWKTVGKSQLFLPLAFTWALGFSFYTYILAVIYLMIWVPTHHSFQTYHFLGDMLTLDCLTPSWGDVFPMVLVASQCTERELTQGNPGVCWYQPQQQCVRAQACSDCSAVLELNNYNS